MDLDDVHVVCDNYGTHKHPTVTAWLTKHEVPRSLRTGDPCKMRGVKERCHG